MKLSINKKVLRRRTDELELMVSSGSVRLLETTHQMLCKELIRKDLEGQFEQLLEDLIPDAKTWFYNSETKNTNDYIFESKYHVLSIGILNGLEMMLEWLLRVSKCWLDSKDANYLCTRDLECIIEKSPLYKFVETLHDKQLTVICEESEAKCYEKKINVVFNNGVETLKQNEDDIGEIKETLEKLMEKINVKEKAN